ncbi:MAG TPA: hypothetical protein VNL18_01390 [Gemmatimonadales bacterium]|nr:hypothetical protein [Gemmatimonadales bacterium]
MPDFLFWNQVVIPLAGMAVGVILGLPIIKAIVRRIERRPDELAGVESQALRAELAELKRRLETVDELAGRVGEIEERMDFAERLLTQQRESGRLGGPQ